MAPADAELADAVGAVGDIDGDVPEQPIAIASYAATSAAAIRREMRWAFIDRSFQA